MSSPEDRYLDRETMINEIIARVSGATEEELTEIWNAAFGVSGDYREWFPSERKFGVVKEDWSNEKWDE